MKSLIASAALAACLLVPAQADAAPRKKARAGKTVSAQPSPTVRFGVFAGLDGSSWEETATGRIISYRWIAPGERMGIEHDLPTGSKEESTLVYDGTSGGLLLTHKDKDGKENTRIAQRAADGSVLETFDEGGTMQRTSYAMSGDDLISERSALVNGVWQTTDRIVLKRLTPAEAEERRGAGYREMLKRWGALAGLAGKNWRIETNGRELVQNYAWDVRGSILVQRNAITGGDPAKTGRTVIYRFDDTAGKIYSSAQDAQGKSKSAVASVEADGTLVFKEVGKGERVTYVRLLGPNFYQTDEGKLTKNGFKSAGQTTYSHLSAQIIMARQAEQAAQHALALQNAQLAALASRENAAQAQSSAPSQALVAQQPVPPVSAPAAEKKKGKGLLGSLMGAAGNVLGGGVVGGGGLAESALGAALGGNPLGGVLGGGADGIGGGALGALTGKSGLGIGLAAEALAALGGGDAQDAAGLKLLMAAVKADDPGALIQAVQMMQNPGIGASTAGSGESIGLGGAATSTASGNSKGTVSPGSYRTRPNTLLGKAACRGYTDQNFKEYFVANQSGPDVQLHTMCAAAFNYYAMYRNAIAQGYSEADANITYGVFEKTALTATEFYRTAR